MKTITVKTAWAAAVAILKESGIDTPAADARLLVQHALGTSHENLLMQGSRDVSTDEQELLDSLLQRRLNREPVSRIVGQRAFWKGDFIVTPDTLDPRADSETLIEAALTHVQPGNSDGPLRVLDLGTGTGCLLISLLHEWPQATGVGLDISAAAAEVARANTAQLNAPDRAVIIASDWQAYRAETAFDVVISNPPYIAPEEAETLEPEVRDFDPHIALFAGGQGLDAYRSILSNIDVWLKPGGWLLLETGYQQAEKVAQIVTAAGLAVVEIRADLGGHPRVVVGKKPPLSVV